MNRLLSLRLFFFALLSVFVLSACDSGGSNGDSVQNEFSFDISPTSKSQSVVAKAGPDTTISGFSFFYSGTDDNGNDAFVIYFSGGENFSQVQQGLFGFLGRKGLRKDVGTGTFDVASTSQGFESGKFVGLLYEEFGTNSQVGTSPFYAPQSGTVNIDNSSGNEVRGSVDISAYRIQFDTTGATPTFDSTQVDITGQFAAKDVEQHVPVNASP